ncbi:MAG: nuclear transport factor 2 family protein [Chthonomonas sp.]|nr:nuclear transport factor 2 family protein [Chthonomonas sp.]
MITSLALSTALLSATLSPEAEVEATLKTFYAATFRYDAPLLERLTAPDFFEISPLGEFDSRDKFLGFYRVPDSQRTATPIDCSLKFERISFPAKNVAVGVYRLSLVLQRDPKEVKFDLAVTASLRKQGKDWQLVSHQLTPIRPKATPGR